MILSKVKMRIITGQSCGAVIRRSHVRLPGVRVTQGRMEGKCFKLKIFVTYCTVPPKKGVVKGGGHIWC